MIQSWQTVKDAMEGDCLIDPRWIDAKQRCDIRHPLAIGFDSRWVALGTTNATNQSVAAIDFQSQNASTATRLHWFVIGCFMASTKLCIELASDDEKWDQYDEAT